MHARLCHSQQVQPAGSKLLCLQLDARGLRHKIDSLCLLQLHQHAHIYSHAYLLPLLLPLISATTVTTLPSCIVGSPTPLTPSSHAALVILGLSHPKGLGLAVWLLRARQDVAVLQAVLLAGGARRPFWPSSHATLVILGLSHAKGLGLAVWLLIVMLWACQDVAVLQAVLLAGGVHSIILRVRVLKPAGRVPDLKILEEICSTKPSIYF